MQAFYSKFTEKKFKFYTILACLIGDLTLMGYLYNKFTNKERYNEATKMAEQIFMQLPQNQGMSLPAGHWEGFYQILVNTLLTGFSLALIIHLLVYFGHHKGSRSSYLYIKLMSIMGAIGCFLIGLDSLLTLYFPGMYFLIQAAGYLFVFLGFKHFTYNK